VVSDGRDLSRVATVLVAIGLRILEDDEREEVADVPDSGLRPSVD